MRKLAYGQGKWISAAGSQTPSVGTLITNITSTDGINWTGFAGGPAFYDNTGNTGPPVYNQGTYKQFVDILYENNIWVSVSRRGTLERAISSPDGITWTSQNTAGGATGASSATAFNGIAYDQGQFVIVGDNTGSSFTNVSKIFTSPDGMIWTGRPILNGPNSVITDIDTTATINTWQQSAYGDNKWVAVASSGATKRVIISTDGGLKWYSPSGLSNNMNTRSWQRIVYGNGLFVAVASDTVTTCIATSVNGINWTLRNSPESTGLLSVYFSNGIFMACSQTGKIIKSSDGINWEFIYNNPSYTELLYGITYANGIWLANANSGTLNRILRLDYILKTTSASRPTPITKQIRFSSGI